MTDAELAVQIEGIYAMYVKLANDLYDQGWDIRGIYTALIYFSEIAKQSGVMTTDGLLAIEVLASAEAERIRKKTGILKNVLYDSLQVDLPELTEEKTRDKN
jgi:hypothetical protein